MVCTPARVSVCVCVCLCPCLCVSVCVFVFVSVSVPQAETERYVRFQRSDAHADRECVKDDVSNLHERHHVPLGQLFHKPHPTERLPNNWIGLDSSAQLL